jgi:thiamine pyrophosphate-dependent acetolactate synthase large subunit-like protein
MADDDNGAPPTRGDQTVGELLGRSLKASGVERVFGSSAAGIVGIPGLKHLRVDEPVLAALLADAQGRVTNGAHPGAALLPGRRLRVGTQPHLPVEAVTVDDAAHLPELLAAAGRGPGYNAVELILDLDLAAPAPADVEPLTFGPSGQAMALSPSLADLGLVVVAGSGVVRTGTAGLLATFLAQSGLPVATTVASVGVVPTDDPHHVGVVALQADDAELSGLEDAGIVVLVGVDPVEAPPELWARQQVLEVEPEQLVALAFNWPEPSGPPPRARLRTELDALVEALAFQAAVPLTPARAVADLMAARPRGAVIAADAGTPALWLARTARVDSAADVVLPAVGGPGFAVAAAMAAALDERPAIAVTVGPIDPITEALVELAGLVGSRFTLVEWGADVAWSEATAHRVALRTAAETPGVAHVPVPVDLALTRALIDLAGPVDAWEVEGRAAYDWRTPDE